MNRNSLITKPLNMLHMYTNRIKRLTDHEVLMFTSIMKARNEVYDHSLALPSPPFLYEMDCSSVIKTAAVGSTDGNKHSASCTPTSQSGLTHYLLFAKPTTLTWEHSSCGKRG